MNTYLRKTNLYLSFILLFLYNFFLYKYNFYFNFFLKFFFSYLFLCLFKKINFIKNIIIFFKKSKLEISKVIWPSLKEVNRNVIIIFLFSFLISIIIWLIDKIILYIISVINNLNF